MVVKDDVSTEKKNPHTKKNKPTKKKTKQKEDRIRTSPLLVLNAWNSTPRPMLRVDSCKTNEVIHDRLLIKPAL